MRHDNDNQQIVGPWLPSRSRARAAGSKYYFTGIPCVNEHMALRVVSSGACRTCARLWRNENKETIAHYYSTWAKENREELRAYYLSWSAQNKDKINVSAKIRAAKYRSADPEKYQRIAKEYYHKMMQFPEFREKQSENASRQYGKRKSAGGEYKSSDIAEILRRQKYKCAECGVSVKSKADRHIDHVMPIALGGTNWPWNLQVLCPRCNLSKGAKHPIDFAQSRGRLL